jgi:hypothetical protein
MPVLEPDAFPLDERPSMRASIAATLAATVLALAAPEAHAIYKCAGATGPIYQDDPCPPGRELRNFETDPPNLSIIPGQTGSAAPREAPARSSESKTAKAGRNAKNGGKEGKIRGDPAERKHVRVGMSEAELLMRLGTPDVTSGNKQKRGLRWTWLPIDGDPDTITTVTLVNGSVTDVDRKVVKK